MAFLENIKSSVKKKAHFRCCLCHTLGVEIHHIIPQSEGGSDDEENAAPLCPSCHETYGQNNTKRKFIREARNLWYEICENRYSSNIDSIKNLEDIVKNLPTKRDFNLLMERISILASTNSFENQLTKYGWEFTLTFQGKYEDAKNIKDEIQNFEKDAEVKLFEGKEYLAISVDTPKFFPERFLELIVEKYNCEFINISYIC